MAQIPLLNGIYTDANGDFRSSYPRNLVPVPKDNGISKGYLRLAPGFRHFANAPLNPGLDRGGINWGGTMYRVIGDALWKVDATASVTSVGYLGTDGGTVSMEYSFDRLGIASAGSLFYWDGATFTQVTDPDLGYVKDMTWLGGYFICTDGASIIVTELTDPTSVNPLKYGSSEVDPDPINSLMRLRNELWALNRYTTQVFENIGGDGFPFALIPGALVPKGVIGTHAVDIFMGAIAFVGSGRNEQPSVYIAGGGESRKLATREIEILLAGYSEEQLSQVVCETREHDSHVHFYVHLPDITAVYDGAASVVVGEPVWSYLQVTNPDLVRVPRGYVYCYDEWLAGSGPGVAQIVAFDESYANLTGILLSGGTEWQFDTQLLYNEGGGLILHNLELVATSGRGSVAGEHNFDDQKVAVQYSLDGLSWSQKRWVSIGKAGETLKRIAWRQLMSNTDSNWVGLRFSGTHQVPVSFTRLEAKIEPLNG